MAKRNEHQEAEAMREEVPSTIARSGDKAVRTYKKALKSAETATATANAPTGPPSRR